MSNGAQALPTGQGATDKFPSGSWSFGPLSIQWSLKAGNEVDVDISVLGVDVDTLSATLKQGDARISDTLNVLGIVGSLALEAKYGQTDNTNGLYLTGDLTGPGFHYAFNHRILAW